MLTGSESQAKPPSNCGKRNRLKDYSRASAMSAEGSNLLEGVVGAWRFELQTSCAQGRRATRLRYAPTCSALLILKHFPTLLLIRTIIFAPDCARMRLLNNGCA